MSNTVATTTKTQHSSHERLHLVHRLTERKESLTNHDSCTFLHEVNGTTNETTWMGPGHGIRLSGE